MHRLFSRLSDFYPRPPRGGRPSLTNGERDALEISIHALREEGDPDPEERGKSDGYFYPRPPRGGRRDREDLCLNGDEISIHALREEGDCRPNRQRYRHRNFYPRPPRGGRPTRIHF